MKSAKVLFLDVDGVLNSRTFLSRRETPRNGMPSEFDPYCVLLVHRICGSTGAKVVVSSAWRLYPPSLEEVRKSVSPHYLDVTPNLPGSRGGEIRAWLDGHPEVISYAILDDDREAGEGHGSSFFRTDFLVGLTDRTAEEAIRHLNAA